MSTIIYLFTGDLRITDNPALNVACQRATRLLPVWCDPLPRYSNTRWGFTRSHQRRQAFLYQAITDLDNALRQQNSQLIILRSDVLRDLGALAAQVQAEQIVCEMPCTPEEIAFIDDLKTLSIPVKMLFQSTLYHPDQLGFPIAQLPDQFTPFRQRLEQNAPLPAQPLPAACLPALPKVRLTSERLPDNIVIEADPRSSFPLGLRHFRGGQTAAHAHLRDWFSDSRPSRYKATRNGLSGIDFSSKFSPWLAQGALSAREIYAACQRYTHRHGASDGVEWLVFELLWRDYFYFLQIKYGTRLWRKKGLSERGGSAPNPEGFARWRTAQTGNDFVDAGMHELHCTGYLSNRMRQIVASYLIYDLQGDWQAGAAWFEHHLLDFDPAINQGNWLYIAGCGTDPRGGRHFDTEKQANQYDADGAYRTRWS